MDLSPFAGAAVGAFLAHLVLGVNVRVEVANLRAYLIRLATHVGFEAPPAAAPVAPPSSKE